MKRVKYFWIEKVWVDGVLGFLLTLTVLYCWHPSLESDCSGVQTDVSSIGGLLFAAATFICSAMYQSDNPVLRYARERYSKTMVRNWKNILSRILIFSILPIAVKLTHFQCSDIWVSGITTLAFIVIVLKGMRLLLMMNYLFLGEEMMNMKKPVVTEDEWNKMK